jgi:hypothetical protein
MRVSVNVPAFVAAVLFAIAWFGSTSYGHFDYAPWMLAGLFSFSLTGFVFFNRQ